MLRFSILALVIGLASAPAHAQVFRPKAGAKKAKPAATDSDTPTEKKTTTAKKQPRAAPTKKRVTKKKSTVADRARPDDLTPDPEPKDAGKDYVKIWDDDEPE